MSFYREGRLLWHKCLVRNRKQPGFRIHIRDMCRQCRSGRQKHWINNREIPPGVHDQHPVSRGSFVATCVRESHAVRKRAVSHVHAATYCDPGRRHGPDYHWLDCTFWFVPAAVELYLLHLRLLAPELRRRISVLPERAWNATPVPPGTENLSTLLLAKLA